MEAEMLRSAIERDAAELERLESKKSRLVMNETKNLLEQHGQGEQQALEVPLHKI